MKRNQRNQRCTLPAGLPDWLSRFSIWSAILLLTGTFPVAAQTPLTLQQAVEMMLRDNPELAAASAESGAADASYRMAKRSRLPRLEARELLTRGNNPVFVFGSLLEQDRFAAENFALDSLNDPSALTNFRTSLAVQLPLFSQRAIQSGIQSARAGQDQAQAALELTRQNLLFELVSSYFGVALAEAGVEVNRSSVETAESEVSRMQALVEQGLVVKSDLLSMQVQLAEFQQNLIQAESQVVSARARLAQLLDQEPSGQFSLGTQLDDRHFPLEDLGQLQELARQRRPDLNIAEARRQQAEQSLRAAGGKWQPTVQFFAEVGNSSPNLHSGSSDFAVGGSLNFALLDPGRGERIEQARQSLSAAEARLRAANRRVDLEVVQAAEAFRSARQRMSVAEQSVSQAEENLRIVRERLEAGLTTVTESLRSQTALQRARLNLLQSRFENYIGFARVRFATGSMVDVDPFTN